MTKYSVCYFSALLLACLVGCATAPPIKEEVAARIKRFGVVSIIANNLTRQYVGITVFGNKREEKSISQWNIDKLYEIQLASAAQSVFGAVYVPAQYSSAAFEPVNDLNGPWDAPGFWGPNWSNIEVASKDYCRENSLDALIVVAKRKSQDFLGGTNQHLEALATYTRGDISVIYLSAQVALIDCANGKTLAVRPLTHHLASGKFARSRPLMKAVSTDITLNPVSEWSDTIQDQVKQELTALPIQAWAETLRTMLPSSK